MDSGGQPQIAHGSSRLARLGVKYYRYRTLVKRRWWIIALTVSIGLAIAGWMVFRTKTQYQSVGQLSVTEKVQTSGNANISQDPNFFNNNQLTMLQNEIIQD